MHTPKIAIISFPGTNGDTENLRTFKRCGFDPFVFRWNDSHEKFADVDAYFIGAGFSYEDRGRAGMVAARDPLFELLHEEAEKGKVIVGHCNGCQVLVESGLIPLGEGLHMCMGRNVLQEDNGWRAAGFLNEWIWIKPVCARDRCCGSDFDSPIQVPIAHGEGRFTTKDADLLEDLKRNDQIVFQYCDAEGNVSDQAPITPNGSSLGIAGLCNKHGNVLAMMPHPERTGVGDVYFESIRRWIETRKQVVGDIELVSKPMQRVLKNRSQKTIEIFIDTIIVNNEERTVEQAARKYVSDIDLKQLRYLAPDKLSPESILKTIALFNPNKETAYMRREGEWSKWNADAKVFEQCDAPLRSTSLLRRDEPDTGGVSLGGKSQTGICYTFDTQKNVTENSCLMEVFGNPHASTLEVLFS